MNDNALISGLHITSISRLAVKPLCGTQFWAGCFVVAYGYLSIACSTSPSAN